MIPTAHSSSQPKRHLDQCSRFCGTHLCNRPTDHATQLITVGCICVRSTAMRPNNIIIQYLCSTLKSCKGYRDTGGFRLRVSERVCFAVFLKMYTVWQDLLSDSSEFHVCGAETEDADLSHYKENNFIVPITKNTHVLRPFGSGCQNFNM